MLGKSRRFRNRRAGEEGKQSDLMYRLEMEAKEE